MDAEKKRLEKEFYARVPKARKINPFFRESFSLMYDAHTKAVPGAKVLNIFASADLSAGREEVYREEFFKDAEYFGVDFWEDHFIKEGESEKVPDAEKFVLPYPDNFFDVVVTTKIIMEHISEPQAVVNELQRVLKNGGEAFVIAPLVRRQHQAPHDYFRFTEYGLAHLFKTAGFSEATMTPTGGFMATFAYYAYFFQRGLNIPKFVEKLFDLFHYWVIEPVFYALDRLDNGYGRDMTLYFMVRAEK